MTLVRTPAVAGLFYPAGAGALAAEVQAHLSAEAPRDVPVLGDLRGLVVPHAGYVYSGPVAGVAYRVLRPVASSVQRVLLLGPPHRVPVRGLQATAAQRWSTPVGELEVDDAGRRALVAAAASRGRPDLVGVGDTAHAGEHSLEVQVPFLLATVPEAAVLPVLVGDGDPAVLADLITDWWGDGRLIVVSTDLSHYEPHAAAVRHDERTSRAIVAADASAIGDHDACGARALRVLLTLAERHRATVVELDRRTSADTAGTPDRVVGYGAFAVVP